MHWSHETFSKLIQVMLWQKRAKCILPSGSSPLPPTRWHCKHTYLSSLWMLGTTQLNSISFIDHITFNNGSETHPYKVENDK